MKELEIRKILCPVDFSESSKHALGYAVGFSRMCNAELEIMHVAVMPFVGLPDYPTIPDFSPEVIREYEAACGRRLEELVEEVKADCPRVSAHLVVGVPFVEIINRAREWAADLLVMGTHGRTGLPHVLIGSVAEKVVRKAPCPVLTVRHPEHGKFVIP